MELILSFKAAQAEFQEGEATNLPNNYIDSYEVTADNFIAQIKVLASLYMPCIHAGSNTLIHFVNLFNISFIVDDEANLSLILCTFTLRDDILSWAYFVNLSSEAKALPPPNSDIDWTTAGFPLVPTGRFIAISDTNIAYAIVRKLQLRFSQPEFTGTRLIRPIHF